MFTFRQGSITIARVTRDELVKAARAARKRAHAPYSHYRVGAAIETVGGRVFQGANVENVSYGLTICAERVAVFRAVLEGETKFRRIAVAANHDKAPTPCGACRQVLAEFCRDLEVIIARDGNPIVTSLRKLLPLRFERGGRR